MHPSNADPCPHSRLASSPPLFSELPYRPTTFSNCPQDRGQISGKLSTKPNAYEPISAAHLKLCGGTHGLSRFCELLKLTRVNGSVSICFFLLLDEVSTVKIGSNTKFTPEI